MFEKREIRVVQGVGLDLIQSLSPPLSPERIGAGEVDQGNVQIAGTDQEVEKNGLIDEIVVRGPEALVLTKHPKPETYSQEAGTGDPVAEKGNVLNVPEAGKRDLIVETATVEAEDPGAKRKIEARRTSEKVLTKIPSPVEVAAEPRRRKIKRGRGRGAKVQVTKGRTKTDRGGP